MLKIYIRIVMAVGVLTVMGIGSPWAAEEKSPPAGGQKMTLMLGGKFCDNYPEDVEMALKKVPASGRWTSRVCPVTRSWWRSSPAKPSRIS
ncbi:MAG: hypothetical protein ACHQWV_05790 [Nitrospirales bacterium]